MKVKNLLGLLNERYPFIDAEPWDNIGLLVGSEESDVSRPITLEDQVGDIGYLPGKKIEYPDRVYVSLELTSKVLNQIEDNSTLITHHPLIFNPLKVIDFNTIHGKLIQKLIKKNINYIVLHTNYDKHYLNRAYVENIIKQEILYTDGSLAFFETDNNHLIDLVEEIRERQNMKSLTYVGVELAEVNKVAVCVGSGSSELHRAIENGADTLITGDITYHTAVEAKELGLNLIDITHFHSEKHFGEDLVKDLDFIKIEPTDPFKKG